MVATLQSHIFERRIDFGPGYRVYFGKDDDTLIVLLIFQFQEEGLVPNIVAVNPALPRTLDPVSVLRWYTRPDPELESVDGDVLSPLDWLKAGMDPAPVVRIVRDL